MLQVQMSGEVCVTNPAPDARAAFVNFQTLSVGDGKAFRSDQRRAKSTMATEHQQVDLFLCRESCND
jgi:hypothetical protein